MFTCVFLLRLLSSFSPGYLCSSSHVIASICDIYSWVGFAQDISTDISTPFPKFLFIAICKVLCNMADFLACTEFYSAIEIQCIFLTCGWLGLEQTMLRPQRLFRLRLGLSSYYIWFNFFSTVLSFCVFSINVLNLT